MVLSYIIHVQFVDSFIEDTVVGPGEVLTCITPRRSSRASKVKKVYF